MQRVPVGTPRTVDQGVVLDEALASNGQHDHRDRGIGLLERRGLASLRGKARASNGDPAHRRACRRAPTALLARSAATARFETAPGHHLQIDFGTVRACWRYGSAWRTISIKALATEVLVGHDA
jgi:hypothetical protein